MLHPVSPFIVWTIMLCPAKDSFAQERNYDFNLVSSTDNIPLGKIKAIAQDAKGYLWLGDEGYGLIRYDGYKMIRYKFNSSDTNSLGLTAMETVYCSADNKIWMGGNGIDRLDPRSGKFTHFLHSDKDSFSHNGAAVNAILKDRQGLVWIGTDAGLECLDEKTGKFTHFLHDSGNPNSISSNNIRAIYEDRKGNLWIGTGFEFSRDEDGGLNLVKDKRKGIFTRYLHDPKNPQSLVNNKVRAIFEDSRGNFWIGTGGDGLHTMDREKGIFTRHPYDPSRPDQISRPPVIDTFRWADHISFIKEDSTGVMWIGTANNGLNAYDPHTQKTTHFFASNGFPDRAGWMAFCSRDGILWITSQWDDKLYRVDPFKKNVSKNQLDISIANIYEDKSGNLWLGSWNEGLIEKSIDNPESLHKIPILKLKTGLPVQNTVLSICPVNDKLWLATSNGVQIFDPASGHFSIYPHDPDNKERGKNWVTSIGADKKGQLWITSGEGLTKLVPPSDSLIHFHYNPKDSSGLTGEFLSSSIADKDDNLWISASYTSRGINRLKPGHSSFTHYLTNYPINCMYLDHANVIWAGTDNGIFHFDKATDSFLALHDQRAEVDKVSIKAMVEDNDNNLWISSPSAIFKIDSARRNILVYGSKYGIITGSLNELRLAAYKTKDGRILLGANAGYYSFYPKDLEGNQHRLELAVTDFLIDNKSIQPGENSPLHSPLDETRDIWLTHDQNTFSFNFTGFQFSAPEENSYLYKLENYDNDWRIAGTERIAAYFKVPPGKYVFKVKGASNNGIWTEKSFNIEIYPPWWLSWWAYIIYGIMLFISIFDFYRVQKKRIMRKEREKSREKELEQAKEIEKAYNELKTTQAQLVQSEKMASLGELTAGIAHEIQNPLNFVNNFSEVNKELVDELKAERSKPDPERNRELEDELLNTLEQNLEKINHHGRRADSIVKNMLQHSRSGTGQKEDVNVNAIAEEFLHLSYHGLRAKDKAFNVTLQKNFDPQLGLIRAVPQDLGRVLLNLYNNAFYATAEKMKHGIPGYEPVVMVSTKKSNGKAEFRIRDNGIGIPDKVKEKIFQPFFTTKPTGQGTGLGLSMSFDIVKAHGGEIRVETREGEYTEFIVRLPV